MFESLKTKPAVVALATVGVVVVGFGTASAVSAHTRDDGPVIENEGAANVPAD
ncbi:MAG: hypothetical protein GY926_08390, partial [bacterium]|nr:hypothetical protein [bacterium]